MKADHRPSRAHKLFTRLVASLCLFGAVACIIVMAVGGSFPSGQRGTNVVVPRTGDVWQVGELHTVQWKINDIPATNSSGQPLLAMLILSYSGGSPNSHVILGHLTDWFPITDRLANINIPSVPTREDYSLYLFCHDNHDASSWSGEITIFNPDDVEGSEQPPDGITVTTAPPPSITIALTSTVPDAALATGSSALNATTSLSDSVNGTESQTETETGAATALPSGSEAASKTVSGALMGATSATDSDDAAQATATEASKRMKRASRKCRPGRGVGLAGCVH